MGALVGANFTNIPKVKFVVPGESKKRHSFSGNPYSAGAPDDGPRYITGPADDFVAVIRRNHGQVDTSKMTPQQQGAYSSWLEDPAVVAKLGDDRVYLHIMGQG